MMLSQLQAQLYELFITFYEFSIIIGEELTMPKPIIEPPLSCKLIGNDAVRFGITHKKVLRHPDDRLADPVHCHECVEILFSISGDISFLSDEKSFPIKLADAVVSRGGIPHACVYNTTSVHEHFCLWIDAPHDLFPFLFSGDGIKVFRLDEKNSSTLYENFSSLEHLIDDDSNRLEQSAALLSILSVLSRTANRKASDGLPEEFSVILEKIDRNFALIHRLSDIENAEFVSPSTLNRWFRKYVHKSPKDYIAEKKLYFAARLLSSGASVTEACMQSGFSDCSHFIVLFKKKFGETPLKYKKRYDSEFIIPLEKNNEL